MDTHIWYFENSMQGVIVANLDSFKVVSDRRVMFYFKSKWTWKMVDEEDIKNFKRNILEIDE